MRHYLCDLNELTNHHATGFTITHQDESISLVVLKEDEAIGVFYNICPHAGRPLDYAPGKFLVKDKQVICAVHGAAFQVPDGTCVSGPCRGATLTNVPFDTENGQLFAVLEAA